MTHLFSRAAGRGRRRRLRGRFPRSVRAGVRAVHKQVWLLDLERDASAFAEPLPGRFPPIEVVDYTAGRVPRPVGAGLGGLTSGR